MVFYLISFSSLGCFRVKAFMGSGNGKWKCASYLLWVTMIYLISSPSLGCFRVKAFALHLHLCVLLLVLPVLTTLLSFCLLIFYLCFVVKNNNRCILSEHIPHDCPTLQATENQLFPVLPALSTHLTCQ